MFLTIILVLSALPQETATSVNGQRDADTRATAPISAPAAAAAEAPMQSEQAGKTNGKSEPQTNLNLGEEPLKIEIAFLPGQMTPRPLLRALESGPGTAEAGAASPAPAGAPRPAEPGRLAQRRRYETVARQRIWLTLGAAGHGAAAFDGWSTRRALSRNIGQEANPLLRPFAHSSTLHVAIQASPALMDYLGHRMMTSRRAWVRRIWWLPQSAGTAASLVSGVHNMSLVP